MFDSGQNKARFAAELESTLKTEMASRLGPIYGSTLANELAKLKAPGLAVDITEQLALKPGNFNAAAVAAGVAEELKSEFAEMVTDLAGKLRAGAAVTQIRDSLCSQLAPYGQEVARELSAALLQQAGMEPVTDWYLAASEPKHARQIVVQLPAEARVASRVEGCFLGPMSRVTGSNWAAMTLFMSGDTLDRKGPFIFAKANGVVEDLKGCPARVAFSFYRYRAGGLLQIFLHVHSRAVEQKARSPYIVENSHWPDLDDTRKLIPELIAREHLEVCFLADGPVGPCQGYFGLQVPLSPEVRAALGQEWKVLNEYHSSVPGPQRSQQDAMRQFESENPMEQNPILERAASPKAHAAVQAEAPRAGKPWWKFWS